jgi:predicted site-specific integrase-resolvase
MILTATQASSKLGVSSCTLRRWHRQGKIAALRSPSGVRLYNVTNIMGSGQGQVAPSSSSSSSSAISLGSSNRAPPSPSPKNYIYARVSSAKQKADLERQKQLLLNKHPQYELISDIGSGINFKRPGLRSLLELSRRGLVKEVSNFLNFLAIWVWIWIPPSNKRRRGSPPAMNVGVGA